MKEVSFLLLRFLVGGVFVSEGIQKFLFSSLGPERFALMGLPEGFAYVVAVVEIVAGLLVIFNRFLPFACGALIVVMIGAITLTKIPFLSDNFFVFLHESRVDFSMLIGNIILIIEHGRASISSHRARR